MLVVLAQRFRQGRFLLVLILALDLPVCLLITVCNTQLAWLFPLCYWPGGASCLCGRIALYQNCLWVIPSSGLGLFLGTTEKGGHTNPHGDVTEANQRWTKTLAPVHFCHHL